MPIIRNGKLIGRGASDMKSQIATLLVAYKNLINSGFKKSINLMLTSDEENGGASGVKYLVEKIGYRTNIAIIPDGADDFSLVEKQKGALWIKFIAKGKAAHGSRPWLGENAILKLMKFYNELEKVFPPLKKTKLLYQDGISMNLGRINGGKSTNSVPETAEMHLDLRYSKKSDKNTIINALKKLTKKNKIIFEITEKVEILETNPNNPYLIKYKNITEKIIKRKVKFLKETGSSDAKFFSKYNIPVILTVPNCGGFHSSDEWVEIKSLDKFYNILMTFLQTI